MSSHAEDSPSRPDRNVGSQNVHEQDGEGYTLRVVTEVTDKNGDQTCAEAENDPTPRGGGRGHVVGGHEDSADEQSTRQDGGQSGGGGHTLQEEGHQEHRTDEGHGDMPSDHTADEQVHAAQQKGKSAGLADGATVVTEEQIHKGGCLLGGQGGGGGHGVHGECDLGQAGKSHQHEHTGGDGGVHGVCAQTAEESLHHDHGEEGANHALPQGDIGGEIQRQQKSRDGGRKIAHGDGLLGNEAKERLKAYASGHGHGDHQQGAEAEDQSACNGGGEEGDQHVQHNAAGASSAMDMGGDRELQLVVHALVSSFAFSSLNSTLASLLVCTRGRLAGQTKLQQPHSMQACTPSLSSATVSRLS